MHKEPDESLLAFYLQVFSNLKTLKDTCIETRLMFQREPTGGTKKSLTT